MAYRVFLSRTRDDQRIAKWLARELNAYRTPRSLVATRSALGPVSSRFSVSFGKAANSQGEQPGEQNALEDSQALVVLCSPSAATDRNVNRDIDTFLARGRGRPILPVVAAGAPDTDDVERDYFPPALCGRGLFAVDLRETRTGDALAGDGLEGGRLKLLAALLGVDVARIAQHERRRHDAHVAWLALTAAVFALATIAAGALGADAQGRATAIEARWQAAGRNAMRATQLRREAIAAVQAQLAEQAQANADLQSAKANLSEAVRNVSTLAELILSEIGASRSASAANIDALGAIERSYSKLGEIAPYFEFRPASIAPILEKLSSTYTQIGRADDSRRTNARLMRLNDRVAQSHAVSPAWRNAYAAGIASLAGPRATSGDNAGQVSALLQAARIYEDVCLVAPRPHSAFEHTSSVADARASACIRFANLALARANVQREAQQDIDLAALERARMVVDAAIAAYPGNAAIQSQGPRVRDQLVRVVARSQREHPPSGRAPETNQ